MPPYAAVERVEHLLEDLQYLARIGRLGYLIERHEIRKHDRRGRVVLRRRIAGPVDLLDDGFGQNILEDSFGFILRLSYLQLLPLDCSRVNEFLDSRREDKPGRDYFIS